MLLELLYLGLAPLWPVILAAAAAMMWIRPAGRIAFFIIGLAVAHLALWFHVTGGPYGPDRGLPLFPFLALSVSVAAVLAEPLARITALLQRRWRRRREPVPWDGPTG